MNATIISRGESHRFRYIRCGHVNYDGPISEYRLIGGNNLGDSASCIRIKLPNLFHMTKYACDSYSTTDDKRTLNEIGYDILVKINGRWVVRNDLKGIQPHKIYHVMAQNGYRPVQKLGYLNKHQYQKWQTNRNAKICEALAAGKHPDGQEFANKYMLVWHKPDGSIGWSMTDDERIIKMEQDTMKKIGINANIIEPDFQKGK